MIAEKKQAKQRGQDRLRGKRHALWTAIETWARAIYGEGVPVPADPTAAEAAVRNVEHVFACERCAAPAFLIIDGDRALCESCWHPAYLGSVLRGRKRKKDSLLCEVCGWEGLECTCADEAGDARRSAAVLDPQTIREAIAQLIEQRCRVEEHPPDCGCDSGARGVRAGLGFTFSIEARWKRT